MERWYATMPNETYLCQSQTLIDFHIQILYKAVYIPPKIEQSTNHGGTFIFNGENVVFAHYDESPGTHADTYEAVSIALQTAKEAKLTPA